jgi:chemotaxis protein MotB
VSTIEQDGQKHEILIIRRGRHDEDEGHHGGVWKIAFADFMTAMMCFFLVMWLINAANEETRAALASYFNPVKLIDRNASRKGLDEMGGPQSIDNAPENIEGSSEAEGKVRPTSEAPRPDAKAAKESSESGPRSDQHLFSDPYAVLAEIAAETGTLQNTSSKGDGGAQEAGPASGASGGESYRDPFAPDFWSQQVDVPDAAATTEPETLSPGADPTEAKSPSKAAEASAELETAPEPDGEELPAGQSEQALKQPEADGEAPAEAAAGIDAVVGSEETPEQAARVAEAKRPDDAESAAAMAEAKAAAEKAAEDIRRELTEAVGESEAADGISVTATDEGVMISISDQSDFGMFEIGSAVPRRELVLAMEKIGRILSERQGSVTINGHTDGRPFRSETYDNWRLSTARAHSAYFMLVRGGLDEKRIMEVAGFADRQLKITENPFADTNRRIEILLASGG